jgi:3',5'-cyclic AMP phosphodiesterase CpdA
MLRIAHLSDIHFGGENPAALAATTEWLAAESPDVTVVTGDLTCFGQAQEFAAAADWARRLKGPLLFTPGNHDTPYLGLIARLTRPFARYQASFGPAEADVWRGEAGTIAALNTARGAQFRWNWSKGAIEADQTAHALATLQPAEVGFRAVACHHPLVEMVGGPMTGRVRGGEAAARRLCEAKVDLVLTGHVHAPFVWPFPFDDGKSYAVGASTLSLRERGAPPGFNCIEIDAEVITVTAKAWTGSALEAWRTWSLARRSAY